MPILLPILLFAAATAAPYDLVIRNGHVIDGTGSPWYAADIGIRAGKIAAIGHLADGARWRARQGASASARPRDVSADFAQVRARRETADAGGRYRKFTSLPAGRMRFADRGVLKAGMWADVVVFDPGTGGDLATFDRPNQLSEGMRFVLVNGVPVIEEGRMTNALPGKVLTR